MRAIVRGVVSFSFSGVGVDDRQVGQVVEGQETVQLQLLARLLTVRCPGCRALVGGAGPWWGVQGPGGGCRARLLTVRCPGCRPGDEAA